jgi:hypothetical protein
MTTAKKIRNADDTVTAARDALQEAHSNLGRAGELVEDKSRGFFFKFFMAFLALSVIGAVFVILAGRDRR